MTEVSKLVRYSAIATVILMLCGCSHALRNRNLDYLSQPVEQLPPLKVPQGVSAPTLLPNNTLPPGSSDYPVVAGVSMTPPDYSQQYNPKEIPKEDEKPAATPVAAPPAATAQQAQQLAQLHQEVETAQAKLDSLQQGKAPATTSAAPSVVTPTPSAMPVSTAAIAPASAAAKMSTTAVTVSKTVATVPANTLVALPAKSINPQPAMSPPVVTSAENSMPAVPKSVPAATLLSLPASPGAAQLAQTTAKAATATTAQQPLSSTSSQDSADVITLTVNASFAVVWAALPQAILNSGFVTVSTDAPHGFYYVVPQGQAAAGNTWMLSVQQQGKETIITPYDASGAPAGSLQANKLVQYIQQHLWEP